MAKKNEPKEKKVIEMKPVKTCIVDYRIGGPLLISNKKGAAFEQWFEDRYILDKIKDKQSRDPDREWKEAVHVINSRKKQYGFPAIAIKKIMTAEFKQTNMHMTDANRCFHVDGPLACEEQKDKQGDVIEVSKSGLFKIDTFDGDVPGYRRDFVIHSSKSGKSPDLAYRREFIKWEATITVRFDIHMVTLDVITNILKSAGEHGGLGSGRYHIPNAGIFKVLGISSRVVEETMHTDCKQTTKPKRATKSKKTGKSKK